MHESMIPPLAFILWALLLCGIVHSISRPRKRKQIKFVRWRMNAAKWDDWFARKGE